MKAWLRRTGEVATFQGVGEGNGGIVCFVLFVWGFVFFQKKKKYSGSNRPAEEK